MMKKHNCDNCGAPVKIGHTSTCDWCKTDYVKKETTSNESHINDESYTKKEITRLLSLVLRES